MSANPLNINLNFSRKSGLYRYSFQRQEVSKEYWEGAVEFNYRVEDARLGRFFSVDPLYAKYPWNSNYAFSENRLIDGVELEGLEYQKANGDFVGPYNEKYAQENKATLEPRFQEKSTNNGSSPTVLLTGNQRTCNGPNQNSSTNSNRAAEPSKDNSVPETGFGLYMPQFTFNISANAGTTADFGLFTESVNAGGVIVAGLDDNNFYFAGDNKSDKFGREVNQGYSLNIPTGGTKGAKLLTSKPLSKFGETFLTTGFEYKQVRNGTLSGEIVAEKYTSKMIGFVYTETTYDYRTGTSSSVTGLSLDYALGIGLIFNTGIKLPLYKQ